MVHLALLLILWNIVYLTDTNLISILVAAEGIDNSRAIVLYNPFEATVRFYFRCVIVPVVAPHVTSTCFAIFGTLLMDFLTDMLFEDPHGFRLLDEPKSIHLPNNYLEVEESKSNFKYWCPRVLLATVVVIAIIFGGNLYIYKK